MVAQVGGGTQSGGPVVRDLLPVGVVGLRLGAEGEADEVPLVVQAGDLPESCGAREDVALEGP